MIPVSGRSNTEYFFNEKLKSKDFPSEIWYQIFLKLPSKEIKDCVLTDMNWKKIIVGDVLLNFKRTGNYFGKADWNKYFGDIGIEPPLPKGIQDILFSPCPYWPTKKVRDTHLLTLIPQTINGQPFHLDALETLVQKPQGGGHPTKYKYHDAVKKEIGDIARKSSYWALITNDVIPNSRKKTYSEQQTLLKGDYAVPGALDIATAILMHHVESKEKLYSDQPNTYTRCQETLSDGWRVVVGSFGSSGLGVCSFHVGHRFGLSGLSGARRF